MSKTLSQSMKRSLPLHLPAVLLVAVVLAIEYTIVRQTGHVMYPIDDPYIHMAMARHFAENGVFGVSLSGFSATSSSPLWTWILGIAFRIIGVHESIPMILNLLAGVTLVSILTRWLADRMQSVWMGAVTASVWMFVIPLPTLVVLGMEHTLHILVVLLFVESIHLHLYTDDTRTTTGVIALLAMLSMLLRFETLFVAVPLILLASLVQRWKCILAILGGCLLPVLILGGVNLHNGWFFFPTSILLKSALSEQGWPMAWDILERIYGQLFGTAHLVVPFLFGLVAMYASWLRPATGSRDRIWTFTLVMSMFLHCAMASTGWFYRYEGYLLTIAVVALAPFLRETFHRFADSWNTARSKIEKGQVGIGFCAMLLLVPFPFYTQYQSIRVLVPAARNIYSQQYQMGLFLQKHYKGSGILANDIGAINFLADIDCLDVMGLGSVEPLRAQKQGFWSDRFLHSWCAQHRVAAVMVYESWVRKVLPPSWIKVGEWTVSEKVSVADSTVSFYALVPEQARRLRSNLEAFQSQLPPGVTVKFQEP